MYTSMRQDSDTTVIVCRRDFDQNRVLYTYGRNSKELKNDGLAFFGPVFESMIEQANLKDDAEEVGVMVHIRTRPIEKDDRWYKIDFVMQDDSMAYYSNFDGRLPNEFVHVVPLSGGLPQSMYIAVESLDEIAYAHAVDADIFDEENEVGLPQDQTSLSDFGLELVETERGSLDSSILARLNKSFFDGNSTSSASTSLAAPSSTLRLFISSS